MTDPDIEAAWRRLREAIAGELRPHVQDAVLDDLVVRIVADHIAAPGWRPPLGRVPDVIAQGRAARTRHALTHPEKQ